MSTIHKWRLLVITLGLLITAAVVYLVLFALRQNIDLFFTPSELISAQPKILVRVGGEVKASTLVLQEDLMVDFVISDHLKDVPVRYQGILPDLFREQQMVVVRGQLQGGVLYADQILAKHDQNYRPPNFPSATEQQ